MSVCQAFYLFEMLRWPVMGEVLAPLVSLVFWKIAMKQATEPITQEIAGAVTDFHAPLAGWAGGWR